ncbi:MAG: hypothetical protein LBK27_04490, partial [Treponema sp.]|nr:hypothetical protein [Treponema sp.]
MKFEEIEKIYLEGKLDANRLIVMKNRRASPAVSLTFKLYSDKETAQAASLHVFFDIPPVLV